MKKIAVVSVPVSPLGSPGITVPYIVGQLNGNGLNAIGYDLNIDFLEYVFCQEFIKNSIKKADMFIEKNINSKNSKIQSKVKYISNFLSKKKLQS